MIRFERTYIHVYCVTGVFIMIGIGECFGLMGSIFVIGVLCNFYSPGISHSHHDSCKSVKSSPAWIISPLAVLSGNPLLALLTSWCPLVSSGVLLAGGGCLKLHNLPVFYSGLEQLLGRVELTREQEKAGHDTILSATSSAVYALCHERCDS